MFFSQYTMYNQFYETHRCFRCSHRWSPEFRLYQIIVRWYYISASSMPALNSLTVLPESECKPAENRGKSSIGGCYKISENLGSELFKGKGLTVVRAGDWYAAVSAAFRSTCIVSLAQVLTTNSQGVDMAKGFLVPLVSYCLCPSLCPRLCETGLFPACLCVWPIDLGCQAVWLPFYCCLWGEGAALSCHVGLWGRDDAAEAPKGRGGTAILFSFFWRKSPEFAPRLMSVSFSK